MPLRNRMHAEDSMVDPIGETVPALKSQLFDAIGKFNALNDQLRRQQCSVDKIRTKLQNTCQHENTVSKRESGHYGQRYEECLECNLTW